MIAIVNSLPAKEGAADRIVERFAASRGYVQKFPGFVSMSVMMAEEGDEVLVVTRWQNRASFDAWVRSDEFAKAHGQGGGAELLRGHPKVTVYEVAFEREAETYGPD
ncbi:MAG: antibiotic biosynthesis monooxygenase [Actinobacteria bacterium]|nr:antibiotic biosynthesis monooxygenase [Actinomycetota bacterium]